MIISSSNVNMSSRGAYATGISSVDKRKMTSTGGSGKSIQNFSQYKSMYVSSTHSVLLSSGETATYQKTVLQKENAENSAFISSNINTGSIQKNELVSTWDSVQSSMLLRLLEIFLGDRRELLDKLRERLGFNSGGMNSGGNVSTWTSSSSHYSTVMETEAMSFETTGTAITADGRTIDFHMEVEMSQSFLSQTGYEIEESGVMMTDPLVVWLNDSPEVISDQKFSFDLDSDGSKESISALAEGKGFLAYDKNEDGIINDGSELFGTKSGDGFKDLAVYDEDGNGFIDEADAIYDKLRVWTKDRNGKDILMNLKEADIGAIYLGNLATSLGLKDKDTGELNAQIRSSGVFLHENGQTGVIQQIDFASKMPAQ